MAHQTARILIVDDEVDCCENLSDIFSDLGHHVDTAHDGAAALKLVEANPPYDVVLLDLRMPGIDGLELYRRIKKKSSGTVALIVTAYASSDTAKSALSAGARQVISKPLNIAQLLSQVHEALDSPLVLVVDDDVELCDNLWEIFHERGFRVQIAHDVDEAKHVLQDRKFEVVLIDMKLPGGDGHDVLAQVKVTSTRARTVVITGYPDEMVTRVQKALSEGASAVVYKPFDIPLLINTVTELSRAAT